MNSPIKKVGGVELPGGTRLWYLLSVAMATRKMTKWSEGADGKKVPTKTDRDEDIIRFKFGHNDQALGEAFTRIDCRPTNASNGGLAKTLKLLAPGEFTQEMLADVDTLWQFAKSLAMRPFFINTTPKGGFNNIVTVMPAPSGGMPQVPPVPPAPPPAPEKAALPESFDDDDIPF